MPPADPSLSVEESQIDDAGVLELLKAQKAGWFVPGALWRYSNSGYVVLGLIVEKVSGRSFPTFLRERIFTPLKMDNTVALVRGRTRVSDRAFGYTKEDGRWRFTDQSRTSATLGDGGVYSSLYDLTLWDEGLRRHLLLSEADMAPALVPVRVRGQGARRARRQAGRLRLRLVPRRVAGPSPDVALRGNGRLPDGHPALHGRRPHGHRPRQPLGRRRRGHGAQGGGILSEGREVAVRRFYEWSRLSDRRGDALVPAVEMPDEGEHGLGRQPLELDPDLVGVLVVLLPEPADFPVEVDDLVRAGQVEADPDDESRRDSFSR